MLLRNAYFSSTGRSGVTLTTVAEIGKRTSPSIEARLLTDCCKENNINIKIQLKLNLIFFKPKIKLYLNSKNLINVTSIH